ncbi:MAG: tetratricopeptide repeat protein [Candidatus Heimdallarchaeota archaeon]|nr:tetratricopeptide repeat protein [Candidatus Heimdallarchaeota archaeon]
MIIELFESIFGTNYNSDISMEELYKLDNLHFIKFMMFQFEKDIEGELEHGYINDLLKKIKTGGNISKREYAIRSLELKQNYEKYSLELYFSDIFEIDMAIYLKLTAYYYLRTAQFDKALDYLSESLQIFKRYNIKNEILVETIRYLAFYYYRKSQFPKALDYLQSEFVNRLLVMPSKQMPKFIYSFIRNFVDKSISLRHLLSHVNSSNNSFYGYKLLLILLEQNDLDEENRIDYQNQLITAIYNYSLSLMYLEVPFENILTNLDYSFIMIEKHHTPDFNPVLEIFDIKLRCLFALNRNLDSEFSKLDDFIVRKFNKSIEQLIDDTSIEDELIEYLLLLRLELFIKLANNTPIDNKLIHKLKRIDISDPNYFQLLHGSYIISLLLIENQEDLLDLLDHFRGLCEIHSFYDTAFVLTIVLYRLTKAIRYEFKINEFSKLKFCYKETRSYLTDDRDPTRILKEFLLNELVYSRGLIENLFDYKLSHEFTSAEYGSTKLELKPDDLDESAIHKRTSKKS